MDKRSYSVLGVQVVNGTVDVHLSNRTYSMDLSNRKGLTNYTIFVTEPTTALSITEQALQNPEIQALGIDVLDVLATRLQKLQAKEAKATAPKGKPGRKPKPTVASIAVETDISEDELKAIVDSIMPETEVAEV